MPIYEYRCKRCGSISEILTTHAGQPQQMVCRHCGSDETEKILSAPAMVKGGAKQPSLQSTSEGCCGMTNPCANPKRCCTDE